MGSDRARAAADGKLARRRTLLEQHRDAEPAEIAARIRAMIDDECQHYQRRAATTNLPLLADPARTTDRLRGELLGMSVLEPLMRRPDVQTIFVNNPLDLRVLANARMERLVGVRFRDDRHVRDLVKRFANLAGREFDTPTPAWMCACGTVRGCTPTCRPSPPSTRPSPSAASPCSTAACRTSSSSEP